MLKLYYAPGTCALAAYFALEEAGAQYETVRLNFAQAEQTRPEYLAINPKARVPALVTDRGVLTETPAILMYIAQCFPAARLAPLDDPFALAEMQAVDTYICSTLHVAHAHGPRGTRWADEPASLADMKRKVPQTVGDCFRLIEQKMFKGPWVMGDQYTVADPYLFTVSRWIEGDQVDTSALPKILDFRKRMAERPAIAKVLAAVA